MTRTRVPLDHNFPTPILRALDQYIVEVELVPLRVIDSRLPNLDDRPLVLALRQLGFTSLVTNNYKMLKNPTELAAIEAARLSVFALEGLGDDPVRATGALLLDLPVALRAAQDDRGEIFWLRPRAPQPQHPSVLMERIASHRQQDVAALRAEVAVTDEELSEPILS